MFSLFSRTRGEPEQFRRHAQRQLGRDRSFFHHVAAADPASFGVAQRVLTIPIKRTHIEAIYHLTKAEVDILIAA
ncbi:hypothetical protein [Mesorhizobium sp.]|uniref:hypothetical protein n=1 Tax=Mesorhizobium sp. TaxID=1871066 RepID=UPI00257D18B8|nr:hypothetical protein [Mesorhizobium sp.]